MTTRKMWAPKGWEKPGVSTAGRGLYLTLDSSHWLEPVEVEITEIAGRPDFESGDTVCLYGDTTDKRFVEGIYIDSDGKWCVVFTDGDYGLAYHWTKLPREKTVTLRVTGPGDAVEDYMADAASCTITGRHGVRVERVEDER